MHEVTSAKTRQAVAAAVIGNVLEWYDFAVYAFVAIHISRKFFPAGDEVSALLATFLAYGLGFLARPLGGIVIGRIGDTRGRKAALLLTILLMAIGTVLIGVLPSFATIGYLAPLLLVVARLLQGFSAGGEWGSSTAFIVEWAPPAERGYYGSFQQTSVVAGLLLGSGVAALLNTVMTPAEMGSWGWRIPFLLGGLIGPVGMYMRRTIDETPAYQRMTAAPATAHQTSEAWLLAVTANTVAGFRIAAARTGQMVNSGVTIGVTDGSLTATNTTTSLFVIGSGAELPVRSRRTALLTAIRNDMLRIGKRTEDFVATVAEGKPCPSARARISTSPSRRVAIYRAAARL